MSKIPLKSKATPYSFTVAMLKAKPKADFAKVQTAAAKIKLKVVPIIYGRAKLALGLAKKKPKQQTKLELKGEPYEITVKRRTSANTDDIRARWTRTTKLVETLCQIRELIDAALAD